MVAKQVAGTAKFVGITAFGLMLGGDILAKPQSHLAGFIKL